MTPGVRERVLDFVTEHIPDHDFTVSEVADECISELAEDNPELLSEFMDEMVGDWMRGYLRSLLSSRRQQFRAQSLGTQWRDALGKLAEGDPEPLRKMSPFKTLDFVVDTNNTRRYLGDMTGTDHEFVADRYEDSAKRDQMKATFHRSIAKQVKSKGENAKTSDVLTEQEYVEMFRNLVGAEPVRADG